MKTFLCEDWRTGELRPFKIQAHDWLDACRRAREISAGAVVIGEVKTELSLLRRVAQWLRSNIDW